MHLNASPSGGAATVPVGATDVQLLDAAVSDLGDAEAVVIGTFDDTHGHQQGLLLTGLGV